MFGAETTGLPLMPTRGLVASESSAMIPLMESFPINSATGRRSQSEGKHNMKAVKPISKRRTDMVLDEML